MKASLAQVAALVAILLGILALIGYIIRLTIKWTQVEDKLQNICDKVESLVKDKDQVHREMIQTMREDRSATDKRLRWLEENLWKGQSKNALRGQGSRG